MINILKRSGVFEILDITKIQKMTSEATLDIVGVSQSTLELDAQIKFIDGMKSSDIQDSLIKTAVEKIDIDVPGWTFVAARLFIFDLYHRVGLVTHGDKGTAYCHIEDYLKYGKDAGKLFPTLGNHFDLEKINNAIDPERDKLFNYLGIKTLYDRYLIKDKNGNPIELPQHMFMAIAMFLAQNEDPILMTDRAIEFYEVISKFEVMLATPTLSNARTNRHQLSSCYIGSSPDNIEGIFDGYKEMALLSKFGGGIGWDWNLIRSMGGTIDDHHKAAGGTTPFLKITNDLAIAVDQLGCVAKNSFVEVLSEVVVQNKSGVRSLINMLDAESNHKDNKFTTNIDFDINNYIYNLLTNYPFPMKKYTNEQLEKVINIYLTNPRNKGFRNLIKEELNLSLDSAKNLSKAIYNYIKDCNIMPEGYKEIQYSEDYSDYICNEFGVIRTKRGFCLINQTNSNFNHYHVNLKEKTIPVHRLIYFTWSGSKNFANNIDHKDTNKYNNHYSNLQELSHSDNISKGWEETDLRHRINKGRIRKHLIYNYSLNGKNTLENKNNMEVIEIVEFIYKKIPFNEVKQEMFAKSFNIKTKKIEPKLIENVYNLEVQPENQISLNYEDGSYTITSLWHPTLVYRNDEFIYIRADEVKSGDIGVGGKNNLVKYITSTFPNINPAYMDLTVKDNNNYFCVTDNIENDTHVIHNTRKGAIAVYLEPWHMDIIDFIDLKKNSGEDRRRAHDLFPALWISDLFMERVQEDAEWTLFNPYEVKDLAECFGDEFKARYLAYEKDESITKHVMKAKDLWKKVLTSYFESGSPFLCFKDAANRANPNSHVGHIRSSNLCTEIFQNTNPDRYLIKLWVSAVEEDDNENVEESQNIGKDILNTDTYLLIEENDIIMVEDGTYKKGNKVTSLDTIRGIVDKQKTLEEPSNLEKIQNGETNLTYIVELFDVKMKVFNVEKEKIDGNTAVCNLASVNLSRINTKEDIERVVPIAVRMLDNVIDLNFYPLKKVKVTNMKSRSIGLGVMGEAQMLAENKIMYGSQEHKNKMDEIMEIISYNTIRSSMELSLEKSPYPDFNGSKWSDGIFPMDHAKDEVNELTDRALIYDWDALKDEVRWNGLRNGYLMAIAPTSSISILVGTTQAIEPCYKRKWFEENMSGLIPVVVPNLNPETWNYYVPAFEVDQLEAIKVAAIRQKWIDQGQSTNIFMSLDKASGKHLNDIYMLAWKLGLKSTYYLRSQSPEANKAEMKTEDVVDRKMECSGCQ